MIIDMQKGIKIAVIFSVLILAFSSTPTRAYTVTHRELSDAEIGAISQNCASIKIHLQRIQKDDAKNRVNLGSRYETIATGLMLNLNLRLVKNNIANAYLAEQQTTFTSERNRFKDDFIGYSQELENLLNIDCKSEPAKFYRQLELTRAKREDVNASMQRLNGIMVSHRESILSLKESL